MNKLYSGIALAVIVGIIGVGVSQVGFSTIEDERAISDFVPTAEFDPQTIYSVSGENSTLFIEDLDRETTYKLGVQDKNGSFQPLGEFTTDASQEVYGDAELPYNFQDYKNRRDVKKTNEGYIHEIRKDGEVVQRFGVRLGLWIDALETKKSSNGACCFTDRTDVTYDLDRDEQFIFEEFRSTEEIRMKLVEEDVENTRHKISMDNFKEKRGFIKFNKAENTIEVYSRYTQTDEDTGETSEIVRKINSYDATGYEKAELKFWDKSDRTAKVGVHGLTVPRMYDVAKFPEPRTINVGENIEWFDITRFDSSDLKWDDGDGDYQDFESIDFGTETVEIKGDASAGFHISVHPSNYTEIDSGGNVDGIVDRFDSCPETNGTQLNGCETSDDGENLPDLEEPVDERGNTLTGMFTSNPTQTGIGGSLILLIIIGTGIYFVKFR